MRVQGDLCALREVLCAFREIYARLGRFMRAQGDLCALREIYARSFTWAKVDDSIVPCQNPFDLDSLIVRDDE
jgi:hypothetical protein